jgi:hypothetical protein
MKFRLSIIMLVAITGICFANCGIKNGQTKKLEGDLYYSYLRFGNFYNQPDSIVQKVKMYFDTVNHKELDSSAQLYAMRYDLQKKMDLLYKPFIELQLDNYSITTIFLSHDDYEKIKKFKRQDLLDTKKKVRINIEVNDLGLGMAIGTKIILAEKVDGQMHAFSKKFLIEDYH